MSSSTKFDSSVKISELSKGSKLTFSDISLDDEWWVYFKPTNNEQAEFQIQAYITLEDMPQSEIDAILAEEARLQSIEDQKKQEEANERERLRLEQEAAEKERLDEIARLEAEKQAELDEIAKKEAERLAAIEAEKARIAKQIADAEQALKDAKALSEKAELTQQEAEDSAAAFKLREKELQALLEEQKEFNA